MFSLKTRLWQCKKFLIEDDKRISYNSWNIGRLSTKVAKTKCTVIIYSKNVLFYVHFSFTRYSVDTVSVKC